MPPPPRHPIVQADLDRILAADLPWERFRGATVLVAGAAGFIAAAMVDVLLRLNEGGRGEPVRVLALARDRQVLQRRFGDRDDLRFLIQDVRAPLPTSEPIHFMVHAASPGTPTAFARDPLGTFESSVLGARSLLARAASEPCRGFLLVSSGEVYGRGNDTVIPTHEDAFGYLDPAQVRACYAEGKRAAETLCAIHAAQGVPATIARIFHTYGPGMPLGDGRVFSDFVADVLAGRDLVMHSDGTASRAFCYLADTVEGLFAILLKGVPGQAYNVGNDQAELTVLALAELLVGLHGGPPLAVRRADRAAGTYLPSPIRRGCPDLTRLRGLGWQPRTAPLEGFRRTLESFR